MVPPLDTLVVYATTCSSANNGGRASPSSSSASASASSPAPVFNTTTRNTSFNLLNNNNHHRTTTATLPSASSTIEMTAVAYPIGGGEESGSTSTSQIPAAAAAAVSGVEPQTVAGELSETAVTTYPEAPTTVTASAISNDNMSSNIANVQQQQRQHELNENYEEHDENGCIDTATTKTTATLVCEAVAVAFTPFEAAAVVDCTTTVFAGRQVQAEEETQQHYQQQAENETSITTTTITTEQSSDQQQQFAYSSSPGIASRKHDVSLRNIPQPPPSRTDMCASSDHDDHGYNNEQQQQQQQQQRISCTQGHSRIPSLGPEEVYQQSLLFSRNNSFRERNAISYPSLDLIHDAERTGSRQAAATAADSSSATPRNTRDNSAASSHWSSSGGGNYLFPAAVQDVIMPTRHRAEPTISYSQGPNHPPRGGGGVSSSLEEEKLEVTVGRGGGGDEYRHHHHQREILHHHQAAAARPVIPRPSPFAPVCVALQEGTRVSSSSSSYSPMESSSVDQDQEAIAVVEIKGHHDGEASAIFPEMVVAATAESMLFPDIPELATVDENAFRLQNCGMARISSSDDDNNEIQAVAAATILREEEEKTEEMENDYGNYGVARLPDTECEQQQQNEDDEMKEMKMRAYYAFRENNSNNSCNHSSVSVAAEQQLAEPVPLEGETENDFFLRTHAYWNSRVSRHSVDGGGGAQIKEKMLWLAKTCYSSYQTATTTSTTMATTESHEHAVAAEAMVEEEEEATVVAITDEFVHPADLCEDAVRAELVGQDFSRTVRIASAAAATNDAHEPTQTTTTTTTTAYASTVDGCFDCGCHGDQQVDDSAEATVIDSAPLETHDSADLPPWKVTLAEEAQVLVQHDHQLDEDYDIAEAVAAADAIAEDSKLPANNTNGPTSTVDADHHHQEVEVNFAIADQEAEVLGIQEDVHPSEFHGNDAEAEFVGTEYSVGVGLAVPSATAENHQSGGNGGGLAEIASTEFGEVTMISDPHEAHDFEVEARATLVQQRSSTTVHHNSNVSSAAALPAVSAAPTDYHDDATWMMSTSGACCPPAAATLPATSTEEHTSPSIVKPFAGQQGAYSSSNPPPEWLRDTPSNIPPQPYQQQQTTPAPQSMSGSVRETSSSGVSEGSGSSAAISPFPQMNFCVQNLSSNLYRGTSNVFEKLIGDAKPPCFLRPRSKKSAHQATESIRPRTLLPWSVIFSPNTRVWVATLQTNQKALDSHNAAEASKSLRAFSLPTEKQAVCLAKAWTPPRMQPFSQNPSCHICHVRFAIFNRACHCRNCGVCICRECSVQWPAKMIPETYNRKRENNVNVCKSCDWLCHAFRLSLLEGNFDKAVAVHATGNVNLNSPFANVKGELFYPVHCAVLGGNSELLKWLVDENCCPIKSVRVSGLTRDSAGKYTPIVTSKGRSPLGIAMENANTPIVRYLVVEKGIRLSGEKDMTQAMLIRTLEAVLRLLPEGSVRSAVAPTAPTLEEVHGAVYGDETEHSHPTVPDQRSFSDSQNGRTLTDEARDLGAVNHAPAAEDDHQDECIICCDKKIDCVSNPCGHQIMCMACASSVSRCPVCNQDCTFIRVYRP